MIGIVSKKIKSAKQTSNKIFTKEWKTITVAPDPINYDLSELSITKGFDIGSASSFGDKSFDSSILDESGVLFFKIVTDKGEEYSFYLSEEGTNYWTLDTREHSEEITKAILDNMKLTLQVNIEPSTAQSYDIVEILYYLLPHEEDGYYTNVEEEKIMLDSPAITLSADTSINIETGKIAVDEKDKKSGTFINMTDSNIQMESSTTMDIKTNILSIDASVSIKGSLIVDEV